MIERTKPNPNSGDPYRIAASLAIMAALLAAACFPAAARPADPPQAKARTRAKGSFKLVYGAVKNPDYAGFMNELRKSKLLEAIVGDLNETLALPVDVTITLAECGTVNAFYDPEKRQVQMCFELMDHMAEVFAEESESEDELASALVGSMVFVLYHEIGHALVHVLDLPITGREEDAVDQLSTFVLTGDDEGELASLDGARSFYLQAQRQGEELEEMPFWGEHSLDQQRFYNILCWVFGQNPDKYAGLVESGILPEERAVRCEGEFEQLSKSWRKLLEAHLKK